MKKVLRSPYTRFGGSGLVLILLLTYLPYKKVFATIQKIPPETGLALLGGYLLLHMLGVTATAFLLMVLLWRRGLRSYASASS